MIKIYGMRTCPDCSFVDEQIKGNENFQFIDIGADVHNMKEFIKIRDTESVFDDLRGTGSIGIPCFVLEDGTVTLKPEDAGLRSRETGPACSIDGKSC